MLYVDYISIKLEKSKSIKKNSPSSLPQVPGNHCSAFCVYEFDYIRYLIQVVLHNIFLFVSGFFFKFIFG